VDYGSVTMASGAWSAGGAILPLSMTTQRAASQPAGPPAKGAAAAGPSRHSYTKDRAQLLRRLSRMEGQARGIARMVERGDYCIDILQQTAALRAAVDAVSLMLMEDHVAGCLATAVKTGDATAYTEEVMEVVRRSMGRPVRARTSD
jgi:CsoR family transcriptional regulator, copper-sensing transcriptional repressor